MAVIQSLPTSYLKQLLEGIHHFNVGGDSFKLALYTDQANLGPTITAYTTVGELVASGYTAGGIALTNLGTGSAGTVGFASFLPVSWNGSGINALGAMIYNTTATGYPNAAVCILNFGITRYAQDGVFSIVFPQFDSTNAIIRINAPLA